MACPCLASATKPCLGACLCSSTPHASGTQEAHMRAFACALPYSSGEKEPAMRSRRKCARRATRRRAPLRHVTNLTRIADQGVALSWDDTAGVGGTIGACLRHPVFRVAAANHPAQVLSAPL